MIDFLLSFLNVGIGLGAFAALCFIAIRLDPHPLFAVIATAAMALLLHSLSVNRIEAKHKAQLETEKTAVVATCEGQKKLTEEKNNELEAKIDSLDRRVHASQRMREPRCIPVIIGRKPAVVDDASP